MLSCWPKSVTNNVCIFKGGMIFFNEKGLLKTSIMLWKGGSHTGGTAGSEIPALSIHAIRDWTGRRISLVVITYVHDDQLLWPSFDFRRRWVWARLASRLVTRPGCRDGLPAVPKQTARFLVSGWRGFGESSAR